MTSEDEPIARNAYDELAEEYDEEMKTNPYNAHLEFPATSSLLPDVDGARVLDAGCGTGAYTEWLLDRGAEVVGVDVSREMLARARAKVDDRARNADDRAENGGDRPENVDDRVEFYRRDLADDLDFAANDSFDGVVSALALGYVKRWRETFGEFARVLKPGGFVAFSVVHPIDAFPDGGDSNYFEIERRIKEWSVDVPYYRRPFAEIVNPPVEAGFELERVVEPRPTEEFENAWPERYEKESKHPVFICVKAVNR